MAHGLQAKNEMTKQKPCAQRITDNAFRGLQNCTCEEWLMSALWSWSGSWNGTQISIPLLEAHSNVRPTYDATSAPGTTSRMNNTSSDESILRNQKIGRRPEKKLFKYPTSRKIYKVKDRGGE